MWDLGYEIGNLTFKNMIKNNISIEEIVKYRRKCFAKKYLIFWVKQNLKIKLKIKEKRELFRGYKRSMEQDIDRIILMKTRERFKEI